MTSPVIEHLDAFEEEIVAIAMTNIAKARADEDERRTAMDHWRRIVRTNACRRVLDRAFAR